MFAAGLCVCDLSIADGETRECGYINEVIDGGASHTVLRPTTWAATIMSNDPAYDCEARTIKIEIWILAKQSATQHYQIFMIQLTVCAGDIVPPGPSQALITSCSSLPGGLYPGNSEGHSKAA